MALLSSFRAVVPTSGRFTCSRVVCRVLSSSSYNAHNTSKSEAKQHGGIVLESPFTPITIPDLTVPEYVWKDVDKWPDRTAMVCSKTEVSYTYRQLREESHLFACSLIHTLGLGPGEVLGVHMPNSPYFASVIIGAKEAAMISTFSNPLYTVEEVKRQYVMSGVRCCVTNSQLLPLVRQVVTDLPNPTHTIVVDVEDHDPAAHVLSYRRLVREARPAELPRPDRTSLAVVPFSSGTTGVPKGVMLTHRNIVANLCMIRHPVLNFFSSTEAQNERVLSVIPMYHIYGYNVVMNVSLSSGAQLITLPKFEPESYLNALLKYEPTFLFLVPSLLLFLASHPAVTPKHLRSIKKVMSGAAPAPANLIDKFRAKADHIEVMQGYGMTEAAPVLLTSHINFPVSKTGSIGQVAPSTLCRVRDITTGEDLGPNKPGELLFKGPQVMQGYLNNPKATQETVDEDGWLHTGDVAYYDEEHYMYIVDRTKELIKVKGNQVSPTELENLLIQLPGITDVAVVGIPHEKAGEVPRAYVVLKENTAMTEKDIVEYIEPKVASYKRLVGGVKFVDAIPRNPSGKILRQKLKSQM